MEQIPPPSRPPRNLPQTLYEVGGGFLLGLAVLGGIASTGTLLLSSFFVDTSDPAIRWPLVLGALALVGGIMGNSYGFAVRFFLVRRGYKVRLGAPPPSHLVKQIRALEAAGSDHNAPNRET